MNVQFFNDSINNSDKNQMQKNVMLAFINRAQLNEEKRKADKELCQGAEGKFNTVDSVILSTDEVKIYKVKPTNDPTDWANTSPYRIMYLQKNDTWNKCSTVSPSLDVAMLVYLSHKYTGANSQFADFALKMLGIKID